MHKLVTSINFMRLAILQTILFIINLHLTCYLRNKFLILEINTKNDFKPSICFSKYDLLSVIIIYEIVYLANFLLRYYFLT